MQRVRIGKMLLNKKEKRKVGWLAFPDIKYQTHSKVMVIKTIWYWPKHI